MSEFIPRITVSDGKDAEVVTAALLHYSMYVTSAAAAGGLSLELADVMHRITGLLSCVHDQETQRQVRERFGPVPTDEEITEHLQKLGQEFGQSDPD